MLSFCETNLFFLIIMPEISLKKGFNVWESLKAITFFFYKINKKSVITNNEDNSLKIFNDIDD